MMVVKEDHDNHALSSTRFIAWASLTVFSVIALASHVSRSNGDHDGMDIALVTAATLVSLSTSFFACVAHFFVAEKFSLQRGEIGLVSINTVLWAAGFPVIMDPSKGIAVSSRGDTPVINANLYFATWAAFLTNFYILSELTKALRPSDMSTMTQRTAKWCGFFLATLLVTVFNATLLSKLCDEGYTCKHVMYGINFHAISVACFLLLVRLKLGSSSLMTTLFLSGVVVYIADHGDGTSMTGRLSLYAFAWSCFVVSMIFCADSLGNCLAYMITPDTEDSTEILASKDEDALVDSPSTEIGTAIETAILV